MDTTFERIKNLKALFLTLLICAGIFILFFFLRWAIPIPPPPLADEGIEVNLGNSETGSGTVAPMAPGDPAEDKDINQDAKQTQPLVSQQSSPLDKDQIGNTNYRDESAGDVEVKKQSFKKSILSNQSIPVAHSSVTKRVTTVTMPASRAVSHPKAIYRGGHGNGGNGSDSYNGVMNQGIAGGTGDQGRAGGNPVSNSYTGNSASGHGGQGGVHSGSVRIRKGLSGRYFMELPSFRAGFNEPAKVAVNISVNENGEVTSASINLSGTTTSNQQIKAFAIRKAKMLKLNKGGSQNGTIVFDFRLHE